MTVAEGKSVTVNLGSGTSISIGDLLSSVDSTQAQVAETRLATDAVNRTVDALGRQLSRGMASIREETGVSMVTLASSLRSEMTSLRQTVEDDIGTDLTALQASVNAAMVCEPRGLAWYVTLAWYNFTFPFRLANGDVDLAARREAARPPPPCSPPQQLKGGTFNVQRASW